MARSTRKLLSKRIGRFAIIAARAQRSQIGFGDGRLAAKLGIDIAFRRFEATSVQPVHQSHGQEVAAAIGLFLTQPEPVDGVSRQLGHVDAEQLIGVEAAVFQRIRIEACLLDSLWIEGVFIHDQNSARFEVGQVRLQRGGVHRDQRIQLIAGRKNVGRREMKLKSADASQGSPRGTNFGREIGKGRHVIAGQRRGIGHLRAGKLHSITGVTSKSDGGSLDKDNFLFVVRYCVGLTSP